MDLRKELTARYGLTPFFRINTDAFPPPSPEFVCWLDLMGMENQMQRSLPKTANFAMKLLVAARSPLRPLPSTVGVCPVIDGLFIHSPDRWSLMSVVRDTFARLAMVCLAGGGPEHTFLVRAAIAYGPLVRGADVPEECFRPGTYHGISSMRPDEADRVVFGFGISRAYAAIRQSPPFGVVVDSSATESAMPGTGIATSGPFWHWWGGEPDEVDEVLVSRLKASVLRYFGWCEERPIETGYEPERLSAHRKLFAEYFRGVPESTDDGAIGSEDADLPEAPVST